MMMRGEWGYLGKGILEEKELMKREKGEYNNVAHLLKQKEPKMRTCVSPTQTQHPNLRLGQNGPNAGIKAAFRENMKAAFNRGERKS